MCQMGFQQAHPTRQTAPLAARICWLYVAGTSVEGTQLLGGVHGADPGDKPGGLFLPHGGAFSLRPREKGAPCLAQLPARLPSPLPSPPRSPLRPAIHQLVLAMVRAQGGVRGV